MLHTSRLALTPLSPADAPRLAEYRAIPRVARYQGWAPGCVDDALRFIASLAPRLDEPGTWFQFGIRLAESGVLVGDLGVHFPADLPGQAELGFTLAPEHQHRGYATEAVQAILAHLFGPLAKHRVFGSVDPRNAASIAVLQRVGMRQEAHFRQALFLKGEWVDDLVFAILQSEWKARD